MIWRLIVAVVLLVVVVGGIVGFNVFRDQAIQGYFASMQPPPVTVSVIEAKAEPWQPELEAIGTANAAQGVDLGIEAAGIVREILFTANDRVEQGQKLIQIDDRVERADLEAARAELDLAEETRSSASRRCASAGWCRSPTSTWRAPTPPTPRR